MKEKSVLEECSVTFVDGEERVEVPLVSICRKIAKKHFLEISSVLKNGAAKLPPDLFTEFVGYYQLLQNTYLISFLEQIMIVEKEYQGKLSGTMDWLDSQMGSEQPDSPPKGGRLN
jgi:hypothetical protein